MRFYYFSIAMLCTFFSIAQKSPSKFGDISIDDLKQKTSKIDSSAGAEVLMNYGLTTFDHQYKISFYNHHRIKIYNSSQFDRADIKIPHSSKDMVTKLKAVTYNLEDGKIVETKLDKSTAFEEKVTDGIKQKRFSMPNVKEGSIIEYTYEVNYGSWGSLNPWYFQDDVPTRHSEYVVSLPDNFNYVQNMTGLVRLTDYKIDNKSTSDFNMKVKTFLAKDVPAFKSEPYMTSRDENISKIKFELASYNFPGSSAANYKFRSYESLSRKLADGDYYGESLKKSKFLAEELPAIIGNATDDKTKIQNIYSFIQENFEVDYDVEAESLKKIFAKRKGYPSDLNRLLVASLREAGYEADLVRLSTRKNGKLDLINVMSSNFNYTITTVKLGERDILLDPSKKDLPFGVISEFCINGNGLVISKDNPRWVNLSPKLGTSLTLGGSFKIDEDGMIEGQLNMNRVAYSALKFRKTNKEKIDDYTDEFQKKHATGISMNIRLKELRRKMHR